MRWFASLVLALGVMGCSETGEGAGLCERVTCDDECKTDGVCDPADGVCDYGGSAEDGSACSEGECLDGVCAPEGAFSCTEQGIRDAIAEAGGPHYFACDGPKTVLTEAEIVINNDVILDGSGNLTVDGNEEHRVFSLGLGVTAELHNLGVAHGRVPEGGASGGGGIFIEEGELTVVNCRLTENTARAGGAIDLGDGFLNTPADLARLTIIDSTLSGNTATDYEGGAIVNTGVLTISRSTLSNNTAPRGGAISSYRDCSVAISESTLSGNEATGAGDSFGRGGAIDSNRGDLTITQSTISGNTALGGALMIRRPSSGNPAVIESSTISNNTGGNLIVLAENVQLANVIMDGECVADPAQMNMPIIYPVTSLGHNIESPGDTCGFDQPTDQVNVSAGDLKLGELADNGGPTMTHALGAGSVTIDQIPEADCVDADGAPLTTDQRGEPRPETGGSMCDVGAFEVQP